ncbi:hypothetical protein BC332_34738 [Capsicum chinense]|nr:hypothetical protein BC332_34738 [Capsicum chinense]
MITLIGFSDGSEQGYGATIYVRSENGEKFNVNLLIAKSKVAPVKPLSVPRLELSGANLLAKTFESTLKALEPSKYRVEKIVALTDSTTTLSWITTPPYKLSTYIANRVVSITEKLSPDLWYHVPGDENPSDLASRPVLPQNLVNNPLWWKGPNWLSGPEESWKITPIEKIKLKGIPELKNFKKAFIAQTTDTLSRFSSLTRLRNSIAWCFRFVSNCRAKIDQKKKNSATKIAQGELSIEEVNSSMLTILKLVQLQNFAQDIQALRSGKTVSNQILSLNPFIDPLGVLRVGGRLDKSNLPMAAKHPAILPKNAHLTKLIIDFFHRQNLHAGPRLLQSIISQSYWILSARYAIKAQLHKCIICFRAAPRNVAPQMGQLPESRVVPAARCFLKVGTDFGGPYLIKDSKRRNAPSHKAYICLFICLATKAIHLELVSDLTTEAFIAALERFTSRRGMCTDIFSDNGSNFKGTNNYLDELYEFLPILVAFGRLASNQ